MRAAIRKIRLWLLAAALLVLCFGTTAIALADGYEGSTVIVSLGDSFSSGEGNPPFYGQNSEDKYSIEDWLAHRSMNSWPGQLTLPAVEGPMSAHRDTNWFFVASSGAVIADMNTPQYKKYMVPVQGKKHILHDVTKEELKNATPEQLIIMQNHLAGYIAPQFQVFEELEKMGLKADYVTITIGGNDLHFTEIIETAAHPKYICPAALETQINQIKFKFETETKEKLRNIYTSLCKLAGPQATIIVADYPRLVNPMGCGILINKHEAKLINDAVDVVDNELKKMIDELSKWDNINIRFVDVRKAFDEHGAGSLFGAYLHGIILGSRSEDLMQDEIASAYSMHPNQEGMKAYADCVQQLIDELEKGGELSGCVVDAEHPERGLDFLRIQMIRQSDGKTISFTDSGDRMTDYSGDILRMDGLFAVRDIPVGIWDVTISRPGYEAETCQVEIRRDERTELPEKIMLKQKGPYQPVRKKHLWFNYNEVLAVRQDGGILHAYKPKMSLTFDKSAASWTGIDSLGCDYPCLIRTDGTVMTRSGDMISGLTNVVMKSSWGLRPGDYVLKQDGTVIRLDRKDGDDTSTDEWSDIVQILSIGRCLFGLTSDGHVLMTDDFFRDGKKFISQWDDIVCLAKTETYIIGIRKNGTIYRAPIIPGEFSFGTFDKMLEWDGLVKIVGGHFFTVGLRYDGTVLIDNGKYQGDDDPTQEELSQWTDIVDIEIYESGYHPSGIIGIRKDGTLVYACKELPDYLQEITSWTGLKVN